MNNWLLTLDRWLPHWFESAGMQWSQWVYAVWQIFRCNPIVILLLSWPLYLWNRHCTKARIVWVDDTYYEKKQPYIMRRLNAFKDWKEREGFGNEQERLPDEREPVGDEREWVTDEPEPVGDEREWVTDEPELVADERQRVADEREQVADEPEVEEKLKMISQKGKFCMARYGKCYYVAEASRVNKFAAFLKYLGEGNVIFVERPLTIWSSLIVAKKISDTKAAQRTFYSNRRLIDCSRRNSRINVVPTWIDYVELSSKLWGVLSSIPILLQARSYNRLSALLSLVIILLDLNRGWLYNLYDSLFNSITRFVKLNLFKERTNLYFFFSIFSSRWGYSDVISGQAYIIRQGHQLNVRYAELESQEDLKIVSEGNCDESLDEFIEKRDGRRNSYVEIIKDTARCKRWPGIEYAKAIAGKKFYVP